MTTQQSRRKWIEKSTASAYPTHDEPQWSASMLTRVFEHYSGTPRCVHFVGFKSDAQVAAAARVFGRPDFIHRKNDLRFVFGGELAPHDLVVYANGEENAVCLFSVDDSNVDVQAFEREQRKCATRQ